jgi:hypothetical protein
VEEREQGWGVAPWYRSWFQPQHHRWEKKKGKKRKDGELQRSMGEKSMERERRLDLNEISTFFVVGSACILNESLNVCRSYLSVAVQVPTPCLEY